MSASHSCGVSLRQQRGPLLRDGPVGRAVFYRLSAGAMYMNVKLPFRAAPSAAIAFHRTV